MDAVCCTVGVVTGYDSALLPMSCALCVSTCVVCVHWQGELTHAQTGYAAVRTSLTCATVGCDTAVR
jgi:hypothetical protein